MKIEEIKEIKEILPSYFHSCVNTLEKHRNEGHFSAWSIGNSDYFVSCYAADENFPGAFQSKKMEENFHPYFDLASLTKPLFLNALLRHKWQDDFQAFLTQSMQSFHWVKKNWNSDLLEFILKKHTTLNFNAFLSHQSHFDAWVWCKYFISVRNTSSLKKDFAALLLNHYKEKNASVYSDLNYMFLALLVESLFDIDNVDNWQKEILKLNQIQETNFFHVSTTPEKAKFAIPSYPYISVPASVNILNKKNFGFVHDTNANLFSSLQKKERIVSGHAGFYGNICDVSKGLSFLKHTQPFMTKEDFKNRFVYGLDHKMGPAVKPQGSPGAGAFGHLGYTGTSFWFTLQKKQNHEKDNFILLTNRTSKRKTNLKFHIPQVVIVTDIKKNKNFYFFVHEKKVETLSAKEFLKKSKKYFGETQKIWDDSIIFEYYNMTELRNSLGKQIC